jgi:hypothetical protein
MFHQVEPRPQLVLTVVWSMACFALTGCGSSSDVHGHVSVAGAPLTHAIVYFVPNGGPQAQGVLDADGSYQLATPGRSGGAAPGTYRVYFAPTISDQDEAAKESLSDADYRSGKLPTISKTPPTSPLPAKYRSLDTSDLSRDVKPGSNEIDFALESH